jgi:hypothetical protein
LTRYAGTRGDALRRTLAVEAARLMAEHGIDDFGFAKRKAAERFGTFEGAVLPSNAEVEAALQEYQRLFEADSHGETLYVLRQTAVTAMELLADFAPRLVGPVLTGTATRNTEVQLHLFAERTEAVTIRLLDTAIPHELVERRVKVRADEWVLTPAVRLTVDDIPVDALVFGRDGQRQSPLSPTDGRPVRRASIDEVRALLVE